MNANPPTESRKQFMGRMSPLSTVQNPKRRSSLRVQFFQCVLVAVMACASYFLISHFVLQSVQVVGTSMTPTLLPSERLLLNRFVCLVRPPRPNEIVVIRDVAGNGYSVKRVIAVAGDLVSLKSGHVYVNGRELPEPYLPPGTVTFADPGGKVQPVICGGDEYFVLGDNRNNSTDSRAYGPVSRQNILGVIVR